MSRSRYSSQQVFLSQVDRLQKERTRLLRERNHHEFPKGSQEHHRQYQQGISHRDTQQPDQYHRIDGRRSPPLTNTSNGPNIEEVKIMLEDIMKNSQRHGMDQKMSIQYLKEIQLKLTKQIQEYNRTLRRTVESDKLRDLKAFVDRLVSIYEPSVKTSKGGIQKIKQVKQGIKRTLERIPQAAQPSISMVSQSSQSKQITSQYKSSSDVNSNSNSNSNSQLSQSIIDKDQTVKKISSQNASGVLDLLQNKIFGQVSSLRNQNIRLRRQLQQLRQTRSHSRGKRKDSIGQNETIINQLVRNDPRSLQLQNHKLKNRVRNLQMQLLSFKSLKNIDAPPRNQQRLHQVLDERDNEIKYLRKEIQNLINHLENSKQQVQYLKSEISNINNKLISRVEHQNRLNNNIRLLESEVHRLRSNNDRFNENKPNRDYQRQRNFDIQSYQHSNSKRIPDFRRKNLEIQNQRQYYRNQPTVKQTGNQEKSLEEYREVLFTLRSLRK